MKDANQLGIETVTALWCRKWCSGRQKGDRKKGDATEEEDDKFSIYCSVIYFLYIKDTKY